MSCLEAAAILDAVADDPQVLLEVELEDPQRLFDVGGRCRDGDEREDHVALLDVVLDPLLVDGDVPLEEMELGVAEGVVELGRGEVHPVDVPVGRGDDAMGQGIADEAVDPEDEHFHGRKPPVRNRDARRARCRWPAPESRRAARAALRAVE
jgi:hypothetical protein